MVVAEDDSSLAEVEHTLGADVCTSESLRPINSPRIEARTPTKIASSIQAQVWTTWPNIDGLQLHGSRHDLDEEVTCLLGSRHATSHLLAQIDRSPTYSDFMTHDCTSYT